MTYNEFNQLEMDIFNAITGNITEHALQVVVPNMLLINALSYLDLKRTEKSKYMILRLTKKLEGNVEHLPQGISKDYHSVVKVANIMYYNEKEIKFYENGNFILGYLE